jgi:hypothetical protein
VNLSEKEALKRIKPLLARAKTEYIEAERWLKKYIGDKSGDSEGLVFTIPPNTTTPKVEIIPDSKKTSVDNIVVGKEKGDSTTAVVAGKDKGATSKPTNGKA